jgi:hypothetical protein
VNDFVADICGEDVSVTLTVKVDDPAVVGVPEIFPVVVVSVNPAGKVPDEMDQVYGMEPPVAAKVVVYGVPTVPPGNEVVVTERRATTLKVKDF